jgi:hypothetical protein
MILRSSAGKPPQCSPAAVPIVLALTTIYFGRLRFQAELGSQLSNFPALPIRI